jgi:hypothetical protein
MLGLDVDAVKVTALKMGQRAKMAMSFDNVVLGAQGLTQLAVQAFRVSNQQDFGSLFGQSPRTPAVGSRYCPNYRKRRMSEQRGSPFCLIF